MKLPPLRLQQIFQNLISHAIKYRGEEAPRIHVTAWESEEGWTISVKDNGIGIAPSYHENIFGLFKRLHSGHVMFSAEESSLIATFVMGI